MSSRSTSPPSPPFLGRRGDNVGEPSMVRLSISRRFRRRANRRASSFSAPSPVQLTWPPSYGSSAHRGLPAAPKLEHPEKLRSGSSTHHGPPAAPKPEHCEELRSESALELDSPPRITMIIIPEEPDSPTSPQGGIPPSFDMQPAIFPKDEEENPFLESLVNNFIAAAENDMCKSVLPDDNLYHEPSQQSYEFAVSALKHYNNGRNNEAEYKLISPITSCGIIDTEGIYGHVNFVAKSNQQSSKEELFFAELLWDHDTCVPTCVLSLEGGKTVGGLCESKYDNFSFIEKGFPIDAQHCYACHCELKHPSNGTLYRTGHVAISGYYHG